MSTDHPELPALVAGMRARGRERTAPKAMACALYARTSTEQQESIGVQLEQCRQYAARLGLPVAGEFSEQLSGLDTERPEYRRLLDMARRGLVSHVIVFHSSRWGRDAGEYMTAAAELHRLGVELHATSLGKIDPALVWVHAGISSMESRNISAHVLPTMLARARQGYESGPVRYGYRRTLTRGIREPHPEQFAVVQELFQRAAAGESVYSLTAWFNAASGLRRRPNSVRAMLGDVYYAGLYVWNRTRSSKIDGHYRKPREEWTWASHAHPAVDPATFAAIGARLALNANIGQERSAGAQHALAGLLWCAACQRRMYGQHGKSKSYPYYHCAYCGKSKSMANIHAALLRLLTALPATPAAITRAVHAEGRRDRHDASRAQAAALREREKLRARLVRLTELYADGALSSSDYQAARASTQEQLSALDAAITPGAGADDAVGMQQALAAWQQMAPEVAGLLSAATPADANTLYRTLVQRVDVDMATGTLRVRWLPALALLAGVEVQEEPI